jgi:hypothetical protein
MASTYGWTVARIRAELTDEQLVLVYLEPAQRRLERSAQAAFDNDIEAIRLGTIFAHDRKAFSRWHSRRNAKTRRPSLSGAALEQAVMRIAQVFPDNVQRVTA